ncbi:hypothetical protein HHK36_000519 [Tetracentron sinense]|uniref:G domain-containing protein n=1 Tax=Tetracentron sinense TaxID=13715 RepID=A0A835A159_TETSI|nr:hypothetical protein HHK36_000498 [Tetracentron sinense]KAF8412551.1 hypothetical protein HHK36_000519 [Tetracentron sinense]
MATATFARRLGAFVKSAAANKGSGWFGPHMAAASRAIVERIPLVDFILEIRDARIPMSSEYEHLRQFPSSLRRIIVLNKMDLADRSKTQEWMRYFQEHNKICYGINSHNKDNVKEFLNFLQARVRELKKIDQSSYTTTIMLVGIPNVGKSALANSLHQVGRISAAEGKAEAFNSESTARGDERYQQFEGVNPFFFSLCVLHTRSIEKIGSHPNIYVLDTPGVLPPENLDVEVGAKLALTGAIEDYLVGECELARYFLAILNLSNEYKHWANLLGEEDDRSSVDYKANPLGSSELDMRRRKQYATDHTQDFVVRDVRRTLFEAVSSFEGNLENDEEVVRLINAQFLALRDAFRLPLESGENLCYRVSIKLLNLYRTGRLGHYTLDSVPRNAQYPTTI